MLSRFNNYSGWCGPQGWMADNLWGFPFFPGPFGFLFTILFYGFVIFLILKVFQVVITSFHPQNSPALEILKTRYASGEITKDEFDVMRNRCVG